MKIFLDAGHGGTDPGATYKGRLEKNDVLQITRAVAEELKRHNVQVIESRTTDTTLTLAQRTDLANRSNSNYFISIHRNAFKPEQAQGVETFVFTNASQQSRQLANRVQEKLVGVGFRNRGIKTANFHVLRQTKMPAVLIEIGFIDNSQDNKLFDTKKDEIVKAITTAILEQIGVQYREKTVQTQQVQQIDNSNILYRVMAGSFSSRENAERQVDRLKQAGFEATIMTFER
ncbi:N-acetylmuramoyl-L-alanine amidase [Alkalithermobacter thermoalcaliphilus JW-YL-7 = DSM 7308]|uniref:Cell wall hydrolase/autolysin n=1 Tax=Alkalithermobacter thermoalcaliphilus JW-YL-7 = DSM 7308 TaxID=1121328 RepID=A0A150FQV8_CLOPD|nr:cell wall hydrolase/autolysin [[Clostridium] paradoxum JW-YL-7 = DSM 7308]SHL14006.1 N-acetylmuramoyl-L-alanine amidase [[Clostridium] paradoxum JW-YL-7 = DSM 7308]